MTGEKKKSFNRSVRGYNIDEVDAYIAYINEKNEELLRENRELEHKLRASLKKAEEATSDEEEIRNTIVLAKKAADRIVADAQTQADLLYSTAKSNADRVLRSFRESVAHEATVLEQLKLAVADMRGIIYRQYLQNIEQLEALAPKSKYEEALLKPDTAEYIKAVVNGMKADVEALKPAEAEPSEEAARNAAPETGISPTRKYKIASVRETIKELNKQILSDDASLDEPGKTVDGSDIIPKDADIRQVKRVMPKKKKIKRNDIFDTDKDDG